MNTRITYRYGHGPGFADREETSRRQRSAPMGTA